MDHRLKAKSDLYVFGGYVLLALAVLVNPLTIPLFQKWGYLPQIPAHHLHANDIRYLLPAFLDVLFLVNGSLIIFGQKKLRYYFNDSFLYNLFLFVTGLALLFTLNVIHPGKLNGLRVVYLLGLLFLLTNALFQGVVKKNGSNGMHPFYRNLAVSFYGVVLMLIVLEGVFMFHQGTHRFNGTLGSRAWFLKNWELNEQGYRDTPYDSAAIAGKRKVLVIGDSFVAGHGIKDPKDRFSNVLGSKLSKDLYHVFNLGVGGSDTRDENKRLREFPYKPDMLIFSWYPNDIEEDGERAGLILQHARSYHDVWGPFRYVVRRSYLWNYLYWRFPHPDELSDYFGYIKQCFAYLKVRNDHLREIDRLVAYGDSLGVPMAAVVFPFLENASGSAFATDEIEARFNKHGVPVVSVREMLLGVDPMDYVVNQNDPHPNEKLHAMVADSLFQLLSVRGAIATEPKTLDLPSGEADGNSGGNGEGKTMNAGKGGQVNGGSSGTTTPKANGSTGALPPKSSAPTTAKKGTTPAKSSSTPTKKDTTPAKSKTGTTPTKSKTTSGTNSNTTPSKTSGSDAQKSSGSNTGKTNSNGSSTKPTETKPTSGSDIYTSKAMPTYSKSASESMKKTNQPAKGTKASDIKTGGANTPKESAGKPGDVNGVPGDGR
jgi:hypothetical protein